MANHHYVAKFSASQLIHHLAHFGLHLPEQHNRDLAARMYKSPAKHLSPDHIIFEGCYVPSMSGGFFEIPT